MDPTARTLDELLRHERFLRRLARSLLRSPGDADDLVQETWLRAAEHPPDSSGSPLGWLGTVMRNVGRDWRLGAARRQKREGGAARPEKTPPLQQVIERQELQRNVVAALARLPEAHASALVLRYFDGLPPREIARRLSVPVETVKKRLTRGLAELRRELDGTFEGGRAGWTAALPLLAGVPASGVAAATAVGLPAVIAGGIIVSTKAKIACAVVVLALGAFFATRALPRIEEPENEGRAPADSGATVAGEPAAKSAATPPITPKPFRDDEPESGPAAAKGLEILVLDDEGQPERGRVILFRGDSVLAEGHTEYVAWGPRRTSGKVILPETTLPASIAFLSYSRDPAIEDLSRGSGAVTIRLRKGAVVSGRVLVNGAVSPKELELRLVSWPTHRALDSWPPVIDRRMKEMDAGAPRLRAWTDPKDGSFRFWGLHEEWKGSLQTLYGYRIDGHKDGEIRLQKPETGLVVNLVELPQLRGRVVSGPEHAPESRAMLVLTTVRADGGVGAERGDATGADGRFAIPVSLDEKLASGTLAITGGGLEAREVPLSADDLANGRDLGDVEIAATRKFTVAVSAKDGTPIVKARVLVLWPETMNWIGTSGADGRAEVQLPAEPVVLRVVTGGFEPVEIQVSREATEVAVTLASATRLTIQAVLADGVTPTRARVWLESDQRILHQSAKSEGPNYTPVGPPDYETAVWGSDESGTRIELGVTPVGISAVRPGVPVVVWAQDYLSEVKSSQSITLQPEEKRTVVLRLDVVSRPFAGKVVDPAGEPVYQAQVSLESGRRDMGFRFTNRDGTFSFEPLTVENVKATVGVRGYARWMQELTIPREGMNLTIQLELAEPTRISVVDGRGKPAGGAHVCLPEISPMSAWRANAEGQVTLAAPPRGEFGIHVNFGWISVVERHRLPARAITITLPPFGSVEVKPVPNLDARTSVVLLLTPGATSGAELGLPVGDAPAITDGIRPGAYRVEVLERTPDGGVGKLLLIGPTIEVKDGERTTIELGSPR